MSSQNNSIPSISTLPQAIRIVNLDSYMASPIPGLDVVYSEFRGYLVSQVPVLRLFGSIPTGEKICVHIHGVFPYIYIPYDGSQDANSLMYKIAASIDKAVNISLNQATSTMQHVYKISLVSGIPMYGYHSKEHQFFKIYLYNPLLVRKVTSLVMNPSTLGNIYQAHEAHLNFTLQFMMDYNLHGMSNMNLSKLKYRRGLDTDSDQVVVSEELYLPESVKRITVCELEGDCFAEDILNRLEIASGKIAANPGIAAIWEDEKQRRRNNGMNSQIDHLLELQHVNLPPTKSHLIYKQALGDRLAVFSSEKNVVDKLNSSVYPAETQSSSKIKSASMVESQTPSSSEDTSISSSSGLDDTLVPKDTTMLNVSLDEEAQQLYNALNQLGPQSSINDRRMSLVESQTSFCLNETSASSNDLDETIIPKDPTKLNISLDEEAKELYKVLNELGENVKELEDDSILTTISQKNEDDEEENELDFSLSLECATTPMKVIPEKQESEGSDDDLWNTTLVPQLDGGYDGADDPDECTAAKSHSLDFREHTLVLDEVKCLNSHKAMDDFCFNDCDNNFIGNTCDIGAEQDLKPRIKSQNFSDVKNRRKRRYSCVSNKHVDFPYFLDGNYDSESSEEEKERPISERRSKTPKIDSRDQKTPRSISKRRKRSASDITVKRQLFDQEPKLDLHSTIVEEKLVCTYLKNESVSTKNISVLVEENSIKDPIHDEINQDSTSNLKNESISTKNISAPVEENSIKDLTHDESSSDSTSNSGTIFSTDNDEHEKSFFNTEIENLPNMLASEIYDKETNYVAKEGCSKYLTPYSSQKTSQEKYNSSGSSSSDLLTPYQQVQKDSCNLNTITEEEATKPGINIESTKVSQLNIEIGERTQKSSQEKYNSSGSSSSDLLTPYQQIQKHSYDLNTIIEEDAIKPEINTESTKDSQLNIEIMERTLINNSELVLITPKIRPPNKTEVLNSLDLYKIPHVQVEEPFYSNAEDVTSSVEVGFNVLKVNSKAASHLPEFETATDSLNILRRSELAQLPSNVKFNKANMNSVILSHCKNTHSVITPVQKPPSLKFIKDWIEQKSKRSCVTENPKQKVKIYVPLSPGGANSDNEMDLTLTLSPVTPKDSSSSQSSTNSTPKSSKPSDKTSPTFRENYKKRRKEIRNRVLTRSVRKSLSLTEDTSVNYSGQITGINVDNSINNSAHNLQNARAVIEHQNLTVMVMELHIRTRGDYKPDPAYDSIRAIFYSILHDVPENKLKERQCKGIIAVNNIITSPTSSNKVPVLDGVGFTCALTYVDSEENLMKEFLKVIEYWDPDIFAGYELELLSWGYLIDRGYTLNMNLKPLLGRTRDNYTKPRQDESELSELRLVGRIVLDVWRLMRYEIALQSYTFESISYHILHKRFPYYSFKDLSFWWEHRTQLYRHKTVKYYLTKVVMILELFDKLDFLGRTSELARLFGIQFYEVLSRGSQFRVESMMLRLAKPLNFIPVSPSVQQRAHMKAPEYIALVMEPESKLYTDPVIVLDFQSLYPSIIIAYNYCFTTCLGRVENLGKSGPFTFGATQLKVSRSRLKKLLERNQINFSPCGAAFVKKEVRDGVMPRMLREILDTRLMVKNAMKENKEDKVLQKVLHNRQLGLKLIANVTYGYTAANFSGRMPAVELGDSVVSKGRETLQRAIEMVESTTEWGARVVYGDTDSLFVMVPGRTKEHAFEIGKKIADAVTNDNPDPIKLKLEKVYQPCILQTKKRYVGYMYESPDQKEPEYQAKGIETVRRDGCPAVSKMLEKCLRILFETKDVSLVKKYVLKQFNKIIAGRVSIQDLTFAKEYRGAAGYRPGACVPALELTRKWTAVDRRNEPRSGERVPYIIINGPPGLPLIRLVRSPRDLINDISLKPNAQYYITRVIIPAINRCFNLLGVDLNIWFNQMPRKKTQYLPGSTTPKKKSTISQYFSTSNCVSCEEQTQTGICEQCQARPQTTMVTLMEKMRNWERNSQNILMVCQSCISSPTEVKCISLDCPVYYRRIQTSRDEQQTTYIRQLLSSIEF
ncbi:DNA polymerase zeta catalytic subunit isoform X2 [Diabrotica virgifera virgifera]|uniref:DNA polymerase zeta catalytic subunit n=1 Tax=Diabrotica virgifera virgifera TaxID=50390 RepID=A0ABM5KLC2_DIAVI|nr:DNA polymerase zeta catalytic subunit isoform X2 [Diabrotica virgifera virgifera]